MYIASIICAYSRKSYMYTSFRAQNFRGFRDFELNDIDRINLIAGRNNSGKTALMEAMYVHSGNREPKTLLRTRSLMSFEYFLVRGIRGTVNSSDIVSWSSLFSDFRTENEITLSARLDKKSKQPHYDKASVSLNIRKVSTERDDFVAILREFEAEDEDDIEILEFTLDTDGKPFHVLISEERIRSSRSNIQNLIPSDFMYTGEPADREDNVKRFSNMRQADTVSVLIGALEMIEPRLRSMEILYDNIHANIGLSQLISLSSLGVGMNRIAGLILAMYEISGGIMFIDEIENGLHYSVQENLWDVVGKIARDLDIQVFATTHSLEMIKAAHAAYKDLPEYDFRLHRLDRNPGTDEIEAVTYNSFGMESLAAFNFDFEVRG